MKTFANHTLVAGFFLALQLLTQHFHAIYISIFIAFFLFHLEWKFYRSQVDAFKTNGRFVFQLFSKEMIHQIKLFILLRFVRFDTWQWQISFILWNSQVPPETPCVWHYEHISSLHLTLATVSTPRFYSAHSVRRSFCLTNKQPY